MKKRYAVEVTRIGYRVETIVIDSANSARQAQSEALEQATDMAWGSEKRAEVKVTGVRPLDP